jgi:hypothetical protein
VMRNELDLAGYEASLLKFLAEVQELEAWLLKRAA